MNRRQPLQSQVTYSIEQVARQMNLDADLLKKLCTQGHGPLSIDVDGEIRFRPESLNLWRLYGRGNAA